VTPKQKFDACVLLAPNFRVEVVYTTFPTVSRALVWHGRRPADINPMSAGIAFPEGNPFEPLFDEILTRALAALSTP
jgi:hypothetical protein